jgi:hypothetical protein
MVLVLSTNTLRTSVMKLPLEIVPGADYIRNVAIFELVRARPGVKLTITGHCHFEAHRVDITERLLCALAPPSLDGFHASVVGKLSEIRFDVAPELCKLEDVLRQVGLRAR